MGITSSMNRSLRRSRAGSSGIERPRSRKRRRVQSFRGKPTRVKAWRVWSVQALLRNFQLYMYIYIYIHIYIYIYLFVYFFHYTVTARRHGCSFLLHIDDDELICPFNPEDSIVDIFRRHVGSSKRCIHFENYEASSPTGTYGIADASPIARRSPPPTQEERTTKGTP